MDSYQIIAGNFQATIEAISMTVDEIADDLANASELAVASLLAEGKLLAAGSGADQALAQLLARQMMGACHRERPALPAIALSGEGETPGATDQSLAGQLRALGQAGDVLVLICADAGEYPASVQAATERGLAVIGLCRLDSAGILAANGQIAVNLALPDEQQRTALSTMALASLLQLIETGLFGPE